MAETPAPAVDPPDTRTLPRLAVFALGFVLASLVSLVVLRPDLARRAHERLRWGTTSQGGVLLTIAQEGTWLRVTFRNVTDRPVPFMLWKGEDELVIELERDGRKVEPPPPGPPPLDAPTAEIEPVFIPVGGSVDNLVPLSRVVPGPGRFHVVIERIPLDPDRLRLRSNATIVER